MPGEVWLARLGGGSLTVIPGGALETAGGLSRAWVWSPLWPTDGLGPLDTTPGPQTGPLSEVDGMMSSFLASILGNTTLQTCCAIP